MRLTRKRYSNRLISHPRSSADRTEDHEQRLHHRPQAAVKGGLLTPLHDEGQSSNNTMRNRRREPDKTPRASNPKASGEIYKLKPRTLRSQTQKIRLRLPTPSPPHQNYRAKTASHGSKPPRSRSRNPLSSVWRKTITFVTERGTLFVMTQLASPIRTNEPENKRAHNLKSTKNAISDRICLLRYPGEKHGSFQSIPWIILERMHPDLFTSYYARIHERNARTRERVSSTSPRERASAILGGQAQQRLSPARRSLLPDLNVPDASPQEANAVYPTSQAGTSIASNALGHIIKLLSDGHGLGPHPSATGSLKRKQVGCENEERGENEEGEKLKENERDGNNEEAEKQVMEKKECNDEEAEKPKEKEEGSDEKLQKNEEGDNEELQKKNEGDNEELQEAA
ncbi:unnamed protein product [Brassica napus]|uniref:(rape) hypothetical protein n=1 Tax=Brassica napus TaxID=3708 RepID=A0A816X5P5_BRANA|nr:unnamed protein product [Brassica napus]